MVADRRYPWMHPIDGRSLPGLSEADRGPVLRWARRIAERTGLRPWFNARFRNVTFCGGDCSVGVFATTVHSRCGSLRLPSEDDVCREIYRGRWSRRRKDAEIERAKARSRGDMDSQIASHKDDVRPERIDRARHELNKIRHGRHSRNVVSIGG